MNVRHMSCAALTCLALLAQKAAVADATADARGIERGRYLVGVGACNDCHTPGFNEAAGKIPHGQWLVGSNVGFQGPWGTSYPANLRLYVQTISEAQWLARVRQPMRPPMPWFNLRDMSDRDVRAIYRYLKYMGPAGEPAPAYLPPDKTPPQPYVQFPMK